MYSVVQYFANGMSFFLGAFLILLAVFASAFSKSRIRRIATLLAFVGVLFVFVSVTPLSNWFYGIAVFSIVLWLCTKEIKAFGSGRKYFARCVLVLVVISGVAYEIPYLWNPEHVSSSKQSLIVFGDSISAGMGGDRIKTWPNLLRKDYGLQVQDLSQVGATVSTALRKAKENELSGEVAIVEIGGNDLFGSTSIKDFESDLDSLLNQLSKQNKVIYLFELPLIPTYNDYGRIQRRLANKYAVRLIPKRILMSVLAGEDATIDSIHLTHRGHEAMAKQVLRIVYNR